MDSILTKDQQSLVDRLRWCSQNGASCVVGANEVHIPMNAIEDVARLTAQLTAVTSERDAAIADLEKNCTTCAHKGHSGLSFPCLNCQGANYANWEWRGVQEKGETE